MINLKRGFSAYLLIITVVIISSLVLWLPFIVKDSNLLGLSMPNANFQYIYRNYDGLLYIIPAKTWYKPALIEKLNLELSLTPKYFAAHLPLYPFFIKLFAPLLGFLKSMVFTNILFTLGLALFFYLFITKKQLTKNPLALTIVFLFLPRFLVVRSIGAPESLFMLLILMSLYFFEDKRYLLAGIFGGLATTTKTPGILLFVAYLLTIGEEIIKNRKINWRWWGILFIPLGLLAVFLLYWYQYGDFFAYFNSGGFVPLVYPFSMFNWQQVWVGNAWLEDIVVYFFLYGFSVLVLRESKLRSLFYFSLVFLLATTCVQHRDISRYTLPLWPITCIALEKFFTSKKFIVLFAILLPAIYLYAWNFLSFNVLSVSNWKAFL
jgi:Gpi18-like mannosyltransferase